MRGRVGALVVVVALAVPASAAAGGAGPFVSSDGPMPGAEAGYTPAAADCPQGAPACIDETIAEMWRRYNAVVPRCDFNTVFSIAYIRVTEDIRTALRQRFYEEPRFLQYEDRVFARMYFQAYDLYRAGRRDAVAPAWRMAFDSARDKSVNGLGSLLLSMNAHINRDMPFMLAAIGMRKPDGSSRKPDHDRYNSRLFALYKPVITEIARRFDPTADDVDAGAGDEATAAGILASWRETAWRNGERLVAARDAAERRAVAQSIEDGAVAIAQGILGFTAYKPGQSSVARDAWCARNGGQDPRDVASGMPPGVARVDARFVRLRSDGSVRVPLRCLVGGGHCVGRISIERGSRVLGSARYSVTAATRERVRVALGRGASAGRVRVVVTRSGVAPGLARSRGAVTLLAPR